MSAGRSAAAASRDLAHARHEEVAGAVRLQVGARVDGADQRVGRDAREKPADGSGAGTRDRTGDLEAHAEPFADPDEVTDGGKLLRVDAADVERRVGVRVERGTRVRKGHDVRELDEPLEARRARKDRTAVVEPVQKLLRRILPAVEHAAHTDE